jgi:branched-chain amino acid transport system ATP-binding protein
MMLLNIEKINTYYKEAHILFDMSLQVEDGECVSLLGRNGAGKTTTLRSVLGLTPARDGKVIFKGEDITRLPYYVAANRGIGLVPQGRRIFPNLSVEQNLRVGIRKESPRKDWDLNRVYQYFPQLQNMRMRKGWNLSGGEQQMLALARALIGNPDFIMMDEPSEGLAPIIVKEVMEIVESLHEHKIATLLVEQNAKMALKISQRCYVMSNGRVQHEGTSESIRTNPELQKSLLGI